jgi:hypothetical protein
VKVDALTTAFAMAATCSLMEPEGAGGGASATVLEDALLDAALEDDDLGAGGRGFDEEEDEATMSGEDASLDDEDAMSSSTGSRSGADDTDGDSRTVTESTMRIVAPASTVARATPETRTRAPM